MPVPRALHNRLPHPSHTAFKVDWGVRSEHEMAAAALPRHRRPAPSVLASLSLSVTVLLLPDAASATSYYVDSNTGSDYNSGTSQSSPWKSINKTADFGWQPGFQPGDTVYLNGFFTDGLWIQLDKSHGAPGSPLRFTSLDPSSPATLSPHFTHGINVYSWLVAAQGYVTIDNLVIMGDGQLDAKNGQTCSGIFIYHDAPGDISNFVVDSVDVSGFSESGFFSFRYNESGATGVVRDITVTNSAFHDNPGFLGIQRPSGSGVVLSGVVGAVVRNVTAYRNGEKNDNKGGGPVGIWTYDADSVLIQNCSSYENLSLNNDGGGYDFDGGTTNSVIENCASWDNWGPGYEACSYTYGVMNNNGTNFNNTVVGSTSKGDGYGKGFASFGVFPYQVPIQGLTVSNVVLNITNFPCDDYGYDYVTHHGVWAEPPGPDTAGGTLHAVFSNVTVSCAGVARVLNLVCDSTTTPECQ